MTAVIGIDCDVLLSHAQVDGGEPMPCLLDKGRLARGGVSVFRSAYKQADGSFRDSQVITITVLLGDGLVNPDGGTNNGTRVEDYARLFSILRQRSGIQVSTAGGVYGGLFASGHYALEDHTAGISRVTLQLSSDGDIFAPADRGRYEASLWVDAESYSGSMNWDNSYWRG
jgi:hypothetical protein